MVGFIEDHGLDLVETDGALRLEIKQAARRCDDDVDAALHGTDLLRNLHATNDHRNGGAHLGTISTNAVNDLRGELTGRSQHERAARLWFEALLRVCQHIEQGKDKSGRLARTGLGGAQNIFSGDHRGDDLGLDRSRSFIALRSNGAQDRLGEAEIGKIGQRGVFQFA